MSSNANYSLQIVGYQQLAVAGTPVSLTLPKVSLDGTSAPTVLSPEHVIIRCFGAPVRWLAGAQGTGANAQVLTPDGVMGMPLLAGESLTWLDPFINYFGTIKTIKFVRDASAGNATATLEVVYLQ